MPCFPFFCGAAEGDSNDVERRRPSSTAMTSMKGTAARPSRSAPAPIQQPYSPEVCGGRNSGTPNSPSSSSSPSIPPAATSKLPSITLSPSHTATTVPNAFSSLTNPHGRYSVDLTQQRDHAQQQPDERSAGRDEAIKAAFTTPMPTRRLFPPTTTAAPAVATIVAATFSPSTDLSSGASTASSSSSSSSSAAGTPAPPTGLPPLPHPHRRQSTPVTQAVLMASDSHSSLLPASPQSSFPPPPSFSSSQPSTPTRAATPPGPRPQASSTPLRARRLQRHRALSQSSPHSSLFPRSTYIASSAPLTSFFCSHSASAMMAQRLICGAIFLHHEAAHSTYKHVYASPTLARLHYVDLNSGAVTGAKAPHIASSSIMKTSRGLSTRSLIEKQTMLTESTGALLPATHLVSLCTPAVTLDLECASEVERDEWWLTFDWLIQQWSSLTEDKAGPDALGTTVVASEARKGSWLGGLVGLYEQQERMLRHAKLKPARQQHDPQTHRRSVSDESARSSHSLSSRASGAGAAGGPALSERDLYAVLGVYVKDIEAVREANRALLVEDSQAMIDMQRRIDLIREENAQLIDDMRPEVS